jgi:hypothetical protein
LLNKVMAEENVLPFSSKATRCALGVLALKNFSQFAVICAAAPEVSVADTEPGDDAVADDDAGADGVDEPDDELELQAATVVASARASAGARMSRRATSGNRIARP